jgi:tRNA(Ile)-lysidine synthase
MLVSSGYDVHGVHVNYSLRSEESDADEAFVRALCRELTVDLDVEHVPIGDDERRGESLQEVARKIRYRVLGRRATSVNSGIVAVGHNRDDQAETVLINLFRGSGPDGLSGMRLRRPLDYGNSVQLVRPLLRTSRAEILEYAAACGIQWREDGSNRSASYRRNAIRHDVLPVAERHFGRGVSGTVARTADLVREYLESEAPATLVPADPMVTDLALRLDAVSDVDRVWARRLFKEILERVAPEAPRRAEMLRQLQDLVSRQVGSFVDVGPVRVWRERTLLRFTRRPSDDRADPWTMGITPGTSHRIPGGVLRVDVLQSVPSERQTGSEYSVVADARVLDRALTAGCWQKGDRFCPLGMEGRGKKVSDYLTDRKVAASRRHQIPALRSGPDIVWLPGVGLAHAARLRDDTQSAILMLFLPDWLQAETAASLPERS